MILANFASPSGSVQNWFTNASTYPPKEMGESFGGLKSCSDDVGVVLGLRGGGSISDLSATKFDSRKRIFQDSNLRNDWHHCDLSAGERFVSLCQAYRCVYRDWSNRQLGRSGGSGSKHVGEFGAFAISVLIVITTGGCTNATILTSGRITTPCPKAGCSLRQRELNPATKCAF